MRPANRFAPRPAQAPVPAEEIEARLEGLRQALRSRDPVAIEHHSRLLQAAVATLAPRHANAPAPMSREELQRLSGLLAGQREILARAQAANERAMNVFIPREPTPVYGGAFGAGGSPFSR